jgi:hypothetical protein
MTDVIEGIAKLAVGGFICVIFGRMVVESMWDRKARAELLSSPRVRNPTLLHKIAFAVLSVALLAFGGLLAWSGASEIFG